MSARPIHSCRRCRRPRVGSGTPFALNDKLRDVDADRPRPDRGAGGRHPRPPRQSLWRHAPRRHRPLLRARLRAHGGLRAHRRPPLGMAFDREDNLYVCIGGMGLYRITPDRKVRRRPTRPTAACFDQRRLPPAARRRPRHRRRRPHLLHRSDHALRDARLGDRWARGARQRPHHLLRPQRPARRAPCCATCKFPNGICIAQRRPVVPLRRDLGLPRQALLVRRPEGGQGRDRASRTCRAFPTTSTAPPTATTGWRWSACARPALDLAWQHAGLPPAHGQARAARRVAVSEHQYRLRAEVQREGRGARDAVGSRRREPSDDHLDARAPGAISTSAASSTTASAATARGADPDCIQYDQRWGKAA